MAVELGSDAASTAPMPPTATPGTPPPSPTPRAVDDDDDEGNSGHEGESEDEDQPEAGEVRRQIAAASRSFDPDHQIRRAMDAFLSPIAPDTERRTPDH